jgi:hypothetical protein
LSGDVAVLLSGASEFGEGEPFDSGEIPPHDADHGVVVLDAVLFAVDSPNVSDDLAYERMSQNLLQTSLSPLHIQVSIDGLCFFDFEVSPSGGRLGGMVGNQTLNELSVLGDHLLVALLG